MINSKIVQCPSEAMPNLFWVARGVDILEECVEKIVPNYADSDIEIAELETVCAAILKSDKLNFARHFLMSKGQFVQFVKKELLEINSVFVNYAKTYEICDWLNQNIPDNDVFIEIRKPRNI